VREFEMTHLEELEKEVLQVVEKYKRLKGNVNNLLKENELLKEKNKALEESLAAKSSTETLVAEEKKVVKDSLEKLLRKIKSVEEIG
jgi:regulator of replication initiation timing